MSKIDLKQVSLLAQIPLSEKEIKTLEPQLENILGFVQQVKNIPSTEKQNGQTASSVSDLRADEASSERTITTEEALCNSSGHDGSSFTVKGVFE